MERQERQRIYEKKNRWLLWATMACAAIALITFLIAFLGNEGPEENALAWGKKSIFSSTAREVAGTISNIALTCGVLLSIVQLYNSIFHREDELKFEEYVARNIHTYVAEKGLRDIKALISGAISDAYSRLTAALSEQGTIFAVALLFDDTNKQLHYITQAGRSASTDALGVKHLNICGVFSYQDISRLYIEVKGKGEAMIEDRRGVTPRFYGSDNRPLDDPAMKQVKTVRVVMQANDERYTAEFFLGQANNYLKNQHLRLAMQSADEYYMALYEVMTQSRSSMPPLEAWSVGPHGKKNT